MWPVVEALKIGLFSFGCTNLCAKKTFSNIKVKMKHGYGFFSSMQIIAPRKHRCMAAGE
jgi:hypothetical protein